MFSESIDSSARYGTNHCLTHPDVAIKNEDSYNVNCDKLEGSILLVYTFYLRTHIVIILGADTCGSIEMLQQVSSTRNEAPERNNEISRICIVSETSDS